MSRVEARWKREWHMTMARMAIIAGRQWTAAQHVREARRAHRIAMERA